MRVIGIDIGTTSLSFNVSDKDSGKIITTATVSNSSGIAGQNPLIEDMQDPETILSLIINELENLAEASSEKIYCIGITGQMHGIVYIDSEGKSVSPLYTWRDPKGNLPLGESTYSEYIKNITGYNVPSGWGLSTVFYHSANKEIPLNAVSFCSIQDYVAMRLTDTNSPLVHISNAASFGLFDIKESCFMEKAIAGLNLGVSLPAVSWGYDVIGYYKGDIPVCIPIGDNQSSFIASVKDIEKGVLVNIGTGSQVTFATRDFPEFLGDLELRPCFKGVNIVAGSSLCGGRAIALLEGFLRKTAGLVAGKDMGSAYKGMDDFLDAVISSEEIAAQYSDIPDISTKFCGTRGDPSQRASIFGMDVNNFTPQHMILGFMQGVVDELYELYKIAGAEHHMLVGAGNALRRNRYLCATVEKTFGLKMNVTQNSEEAAYGAALYSLVCTGVCKSVEEAQLRIEYKA